MKINPVFYVVIIVVLSILGVASILLLKLYGGENNTSETGTIILSFLAPTILSILAMMVKDIHKDINSRMTELLAKTQTAAHAAGKIEAEVEAEFKAVDDKKTDKKGTVRHTHIHHTKDKQE